MTQEQWPDPILKAWVCYEMLRMLGFHPDQIAIGAVMGTAFGAITQVVRVQLNADSQEFGIHAALWSKTPEEFEDIWDRFGDALISKDPAVAIPEKLLRDAYAKFSPEFDPTALVAGIMQKGITIPIVAKKRV